MTETTPALGDAWRYPFLWSREARAGETEGRKERPVAVAVLIRNADGAAEVLMVPITSVPQTSPFAIVVPEIEKRRAGLDAHLPLWVVTDEANVDLPGASYYLEPGNRLGGFSLSFLKQAQTLMVEAIKARKLHRTARR